MSPRHRGRRHGHGPGANGPGPNGTNGTGAATLEGTTPVDGVAEHAPVESGGSVPSQRGSAAAATKPAEPAGPATAAKPAAARPAATAVAEGELEEADGERKPACTLAQMRRFIKSRPYVPVHELRRRFEIDGIEDEVSPLPTDKGTYFVGLPSEEAGYLSELIKSGDVGVELLLDPDSPAVVGVFPMRPVARQ